jgi:hypothetical protein
MGTNLIPYLFNVDCRQPMAMSGFPGHSSDEGKYLLWNILLEADKEHNLKRFFFMQCSKPILYIVAILLTAIDYSIVPK